MNRMLIPKYNGSETTNEDIVYSFFRLIMNNKGYSLDYLNIEYKIIFYSSCRFPPFF